MDVINFTAFGAIGLVVAGGIYLAVRFFKKIFSAEYERGKSDERISEMQQQAKTADKVGKVMAEKRDENSGADRLRDHSF